MAPRPTDGVSQSRAAAAAHRRMSASAARRRTSSEVMLVTSQSFPSQQYQELLNFVKSLQLPADVNCLFTTVRNEQVAERKSAVSSQSKEQVDAIMRVGGQKLALLAEVADELGLSASRESSPPPRASNPLPTLQSASKLDIVDALSSIERTSSPGPSRCIAPGNINLTDPSSFGNSFSSSTLTQMPGSAGSSPSKGCGTDDFARQHRQKATKGILQTVTAIEDGSNSTADTTAAAAAGFAVELDVIPAPAFVCDRKGLVQCWNAAIAELTGWASIDVVGKSLADTLVPEDFRERVRKALIITPAASAALRLQTVDGRVLELRARLSDFELPVDTSALCDGILAVGIDVTNILSHAAAALQEVHDLKRLIDCANAPIFGINATSLITEWNRKATQITGRTKWEVVGRRLEEFIQPEDRASVVEVLDNALRGKETANFEFPLYTKAAERVEILLNAATRRDANGEIVGVVGVGQDITELNTGKAELSRVANDLKMLIESANAPILGVDTQGIINEWNKKAAEITGYTALEMKGQKLVTASAIREEFRESVAQVLKSDPRLRACTMQLCRLSTYTDPLTAYGDLPGADACHEWH